MAKKLTQGEIHGAVEEALRSPCSGEELLLRMEALALKYPSTWREPSFQDEIALWGPALYRNNRVRFRPFILSRLNVFQPRLVETWKKHSTVMEGWMRDADSLDDAEVFQRLYQWKLTTLKREKAREMWQGDLLRRLAAAGTPAARQGVLSRFRQHYELDEDSAITLFRADPKLTPSFIVDRLPWRFFWGGKEKREPWKRLMEEARRQGSEDLYFRLYRRQTPADQWKSDALALARSVADPAELCRALEQHHIQAWDADHGEVLLALIKARGRDVFPYIRTHLRGAFGWHEWKGKKSWYKDILALAREKGWWDLYAAAVRTCGPPKDFSAEVAALAADRGAPANEIESRLLLLAGVSREWHFTGWSLFEMRALDDMTALALYDRFPALASGPFRKHITAHNAHPALRSRLVQKRDHDFLDYLASKMTLAAGWRDLSKEMNEEISAFAAYYESLKVDSGEFLRRAGNVLGKLPAFAIYNYDALIEKNALARLFFTRSASRFLDEPSAIRDLLESPQIHVQILALRALSLDDPRARAVGAQCLDLLLPMLLRKLRRPTRLLAFGVLKNTARHSEETAARVLAKARMALDLPDQKYPKEQLIGLIGAILSAWPALCSASEQPLVYGMASA